MIFALTACGSLKDYWNDIAKDMSEDTEVTSMNEITNEEVNKEINEEVNRKTERNTDDTDVDTTTEVQKLPVEGDALEETTGTSIEAGVSNIYEDKYSEVIEKYIELINEKMDMFQVRKEPFPYEGGACYNSVIAYYSLDSAGYKITDIDENGIPELIIGACNSSFVLDIYTIHDDEIVLLGSSSERSDLYYCGGNQFYSQGSDGAAYYSCESYAIVSGQKQILETVYTEPEDEENYSEQMVYYYSTISSYDSENAVRISYDEYIDKQNEFLNCICEIPDLIPLAEYERVK